MLLFRHFDLRQHLSLVSDPSVGEEGGARTKFHDVDFPYIPFFDQFAFDFDGVADSNVSGLPFRFPCFFLFTVVFSVWHHRSMVFPSHDKLNGCS